MFRIAMVSIIVIIGLTGCGEDVSQKPMNKEKLTSDVTSSLDKNKVSTQDVRKNDVQAVAIQSQTRQESQAVVASLVKEEKVATEVHAEALKPVKEKITTEVVKEKIATAVHAEALKPVKEKINIEAVKEKALAEVSVIKKAKVVAAPVNVKKATLDSVPAVSPKQEVALGDAVNGKKLAKRCASCHDFGTRNKVGPPLQGVFNRAAGQSGFKKHSAAFKTANWVWDDSHLLKWLCKSKGAIKEFTGDPTAKTKMPNQKMCGKKGLDIVAYLKTI